MNLLRNDGSPVLENPFFHRGPIRDRRYFFGRESETRRALQMLRQDQCVSIVGPRRIGKTSYLFHLCDSEVQREHEFHYAGHGTYSPDSPEGAALYFWEETQGNGEIKTLTASQLAGLVQNTPLRFVYLSSCRGAQTAPPDVLLDDDFLGVMDGLVMGGVPAVLGFRWPVSDGGAQLLAQSFYTAWLARGTRLDKALCEARRAVADQRGRDERAWFSPVLVMRASSV